MARFDRIHLFQTMEKKSMVPLFFRDDVAIKGTCPWTNMIPTEGVSPDQENLQGWFKADVTCVGMGSQLFSKNIFTGCNMFELTHRVKSLSIIENLKS